MAFCKGHGVIGIWSDPYYLQDQAFTVGGVKMEAKGQVTAEKYAADISSIREAQLRIGPFIHRTPVVSSETLDAIAGRKLLFKCECFQKG